MAMTSIYMLEVVIVDALELSITVRPLTRRHQLRSQHHPGFPTPRSSFQPWRQAPLEATMVVNSSWLSPTFSNWLPFMMSIIAAIGYGVGCLIHPLCASLQSEIDLSDDFIKQWVLGVGTDTHMGFNLGYLVSLRHAWQSQNVPHSFWWCVAGKPQDSAHSFILDGLQ